MCESLEALELATTADLGRFGRIGRALVRSTKCLLSLHVIHQGINLTRKRFKNISKLYDDYLSC